MKKDYDQISADGVDAVMSMARAALNLYGNDPKEAATQMATALDKVHREKGQVADFTLMMSILAIRAALNEQMPPEPS